MSEHAELVARLRGIYRTPITDGHGPAGGDEPDNPTEHVRTFAVPPIQREAADAIDALVAERDRLREEVAIDNKNIADLMAQVDRLGNERDGLRTVIDRLRRMPDGRLADYVEARDRTMVHVVGGSHGIAAAEGAK